MTDLNPYAAPKALVQDRGAGHGRPVWVTIILGYYVLAAVSTAISYAVIGSGVVPIPDAQRKYLASMSALDHAMTIGLLGLRLYAAIQLFRLRRIAAILFPAAFLASLLAFLWRLGSQGMKAMLSQAGIGAFAFAWGLAIVICIYAWHLRKRGVLK
jgi:hypothetical protein